MFIFSTYKLWYIEESRLVKKLAHIFAYVQAYYISKLGFIVRWPLAAEVIMVGTNEEVRWHSMESDTSLH